MQQTFYQPPPLETLAKCKSAARVRVHAESLAAHHPSTYDRFPRRLKISISENHYMRYGAFRLTEEVHASWRTTLDCAQALGARIVFQCPASFTATDEHIENLRDFLGCEHRGAKDLCLPGSLAVSGPAL